MSGNGPLTGKVFNNRYEIGERIGTGGMAEVYVAMDLVLGRTVAVKVMLPQYASDEDFMRRFRQEAAASANLQSPYIVNVYDWGHDNDMYYIVMEYVHGSDLKTAIEERGAINQRKVAEIGAQVCQALSVAHQQDIIHRDVKPQNIMVQPDGNVKVMDFGIARAKNSTADKTQTVLGTAHYTSPEQAQGRDLTAASDIYSLGIVLYEASTGTLPFDGPDAVSVALMQVRDFPPMPSEINPNIDPDLEAIIMTAMQKEPGQRFATANDMRLALNDYLAGRPIAYFADSMYEDEAYDDYDDGFTSAQTSVISPIGQAAGMDPTNVMPPVSGYAPGETAPYNGVGGQGRSNRRYYGDNQEKQGSKKGVIIAIVAVVAIALIAGIAFALFGHGEPKEPVEVPTVVGMTSKEAIAAIEDAGFTVKTESVFDASKEPGTVVAQDPNGGTKAEKGSKVTIKVSQGDEQVAVPSVTGETEKAARQILTDAGFLLGNVKTQDSDTVEEGKIISQSPSANSKANKGSAVDVVVSSGKGKKSVPNLSGLSLDGAIAKAKEAGFSASQSGSEFSNSVPEGSVISQTPTAGSEAAAGTNISVVVSKGPDKPKQATVPNVVGYTEDGAISALESAGLNASVTSSYSSQFAEGTVIQQSIDSGREVDLGTTVTIEVSKGPQPQPSSSNASSASDSSDTGGSSGSSGNKSKK